MLPVFSTFIGQRGRRTSLRLLSSLSTLTLGAALLSSCADRPGTADAPAAADRGPGLSLPGADPRTPTDPLYLTVGAEIGLDAPVVGDVGGWKRFPAIACGGGQCLVVWEDLREDFANEYAVNVPLFAARVAPDGTPIDSPAFRIGRGGKPAVASDGAGFLVTYVGAPGAACNECGVRIDTNGAILDATPLTIAATGKDRAPAVAWNGAAYQAVWACGSTTTICSAQITPAGVVGPMVSLPLPVAPYDPPRPHRQLRVASDGTGSLVLGWSPTFALSAIRLDAQGAPVGAAFPVGPTPSYASDDLALTFDGTNYVAAWSQEDLEQVSAARITSAGAVLDPGGVVLDTPSLGEPATHLAAASHGGVTTVFWHLWSDEQDFRPLRAARMSAGGVPLDAAPIDLGLGRDLAAAGSGAEALLIFEDGPFPDYGIIHADLLARRVAADGTLPAPPSRVATGVNGQQGPALAFDGTNYLAVWTDTRAGGIGGVYGARITPNGQVLDPDGIEIVPAIPSVPGNLGEYRYAIRVGFDGTDFIVQWETTEYGPYDGCAGGSATRVSQAGVVLGGVPVAPAACMAITMGNSPGGTLFVAYDEYITGAVVARFVNDQGVANAPVTLDIPDIYYAPWSLSFDGTNYLATWSKDFGLAGMRMSPTGVLVDTALFPIASAAAPVVEERAAVAVFDGQNHVMVWVSKDGSGAHVLRGARISPAGAVLDPDGFVIAPIVNGCGGSQPKAFPSAAFDGQHIVVTWREREATAGGCEVALRGVELSPGGMVEPVFTVAPPGLDTRATALASDGAGKTLALYSRFMLGAPFDNYRVRGRILGEMGGSGGAGGAGGSGGEGSGGSGGGSGGSGGSGGGS
ncbi:hypothetical protein, partial [Polyangium fumosum]